MDSEVQAFKDAMVEKASAKEAMLIALQAGNLAEAQGQDATFHWDQVASSGIRGSEGVAFAEMQRLADSFVRAHPEQFELVKPYSVEGASFQFLNPDGSILTLSGLEMLVRLIEASRLAGAEEVELKLSMYELATFERQTIGATPQAKLRYGNGG